MTTFLRVLENEDKALNLLAICSSLRSSSEDVRAFDVSPESFLAVPGAPFAYWVSEAVRGIFRSYPLFEGTVRSARQGLATANDFRFVRLWWERRETSLDWWGFAKGGAFSPFYSDVYLVINWADDGKVMKAWADPLYGNSGWSRILKSTDYYARPGLTWPRRTSSGLSMRVMPEGCIFADKGPAAFTEDDAPETLLALLALTRSAAFERLISLQLAAADAAARSYEVGIIQKTPVPDLNRGQKVKLATLARGAWSRRRNLDTIAEPSHAFHLPAALRAHLGDYDPQVIAIELVDIQAEIDEIAFDLYGFNDIDRAAALGSSGSTDDDANDAAEDTDDSEDDDGAEVIDQTDGLLSWAAGVAFGRFDWRLATGEREAPSEPDPFDPLPAKSPGMLPDGAAPFHAHGGILVDDQGHPHDLPRLIEDVLARVHADVPGDVRRWLQRDFFPLHLKQYSKSRRKAPIYWPLSTPSGNYTLWLYYPRLTSQTLYSAVNDFVVPKLKQVEDDLSTLRAKGSARTSDDEKRFADLTFFERELIDLREVLLRIAPDYRPNHDDGVQITAAPLWQLFRHKPWQKVLKETWDKLEKGEYDWAHLAMAYWPDRVREKCKTDKSLAIAHDLEALYVEPEAKPKKGRAK